MLGLALSSLALALKAVWRNKLRATLTVVGISIGVLAVVLVDALGTGTRDSVSRSIASLGSNAIWAFPRSANVSGARAAQATGGRMTEDDGRAVVAESTSVATWAPLGWSKVQVVAEGRNVPTNVTGTTRAYFPIRAFTIARGDTWAESSEILKERVCVLGRTVSDNLFGPEDPVGRTVRIGNHPFRVVGLLESKGQSTFGSDQDDVILMPMSTFRSHISGNPGRVVNALVFSATAAETTDRAVAQTTEILSQRHHIEEGKEADFVVHSQAEFQSMQEGIFQALSALLLSVAAVSLVVGGVGVMNIMLVSVAERTREIGIRMAIGAREADILAQFLVEAVVLSLLGGAAGLGLSFGIVAVASRVFLPMKVAPLAALVALATSSAIGLVFGFLPARRAAKLDPVQALGRELGRQ